MNLTKIKTALSNLYTETGPERVGFISHDDTIIEVANISPKPEEGFIVGPKDIIKYTEGQSWASWHTHPNALSNLSGEDYSTFQDYADLIHFVVGSDGVKAYKFDRDKKALMEIK